LAALLVSGGFTYLLSRKISNRSLAQHSLRRCVAVARDVQAGEVLKPDMLTLVEWPSTQPLAGSFSKTEDLTGRASIYPLAAGQPVIDRYLAAAGSGIGLTAKIPQGMRATALKSNEVVGVAGFLFPGSRVDVLVTYRAEVSPTTATQIVLQDVEVLTAGQKLEPDPQGKPETVSVVTLLLKPEEAQRVVLAGSQGFIQFVLRNGSDHEVVDTLPFSTAQLGGAPAAPINKAAVSATRIPRPSYSVETIAGEKHLISSFN
jgi:pilus assembly protein CpaB